MDSNREWYLEVRANLLNVVAELLKEMMETEPGLSSLEPKACVFRQNRDIRFSTNKNPYKNNMAVYFAVGGKKSENPGYYLHIQPGASFVGGGLYAPSPGILKRLRQEIDYSGEDLAAILNQREFSHMFGSMEGESLKTSPRDYSPDHPYIKYLRMKNFIVSRPISDSEILSGEYIGKTLESFRKIKPLNDFLSKAIEEAEIGSGLL